MSAKRRKTPDHTSYRLHRRQTVGQIVGPVVLAAVLLIVAPGIVWATRLGGQGDVARWAAISTIWMLVPVMIALVILLILLVVLIFVLTQVNVRIPTYSRPMQLWASRAAAITARGTALVRRPVLAARALSQAARRGFARLRERL